MTFNKTPWGPVAKTTATDAQQPDSPAQMAARGRVRRVAAFWNALTNDQQAAFSVAAQASREAGEGGRKSYALSGYALYSRLANVWLQAQGDAGTPPKTVPSAAYAGESATITASVASGQITVTASAAFANPDSVVQFELQPLKRASRKPAKEGYRVFGFLPLGGGGSLQKSVAPGAYAARYCFVDSATGQRTSFVEIAVSGVALAVETGGGEAEKPAARKKAA